MEKTDRNIQPPYKLVDNLNISEPGRTALGNGIPLWLINSGTAGALRVEILFETPFRHQKGPLVAPATNSMITEGTSTRDSGEISGELEYYGAYLNQFANRDFAGLALYTLEKHLEPLLGIVSDVVRNPVFPGEELSVYLSNKKEEFAVNSKKVKFLAHREFVKLLFGHSHPYGQLPEMNDFDELDREELAELHKSAYHAGNCKIIVAGGFDEDKTFGMLNRFFGDSEWSSNGEVKEDFPQASSSGCKKKFVPKPKNVQSAIRAGRPLFNKSNPLFPEMMVVNEVLGGYFGSRLMKNLREEKGYTYSVGSALVSHKYGGYLTVATEVGSHVSDEALKEIHRELSLLREEPVPGEELQLVKNFMMGELLRSFDGPFSIADSLRPVILHGEDFSFYKRTAAAIRDMTSVRLQELAARFLKEEDMCEVVAGKMKNPF